MKPYDQIVEEHEERLGNHEVHIANNSIRITKMESILEEHRVIIEMITDLQTTIQTGLKWVKGITAILIFISTILGLIFMLSA